MTLTDWEKQTRNRVLRTLMQTHESTERLWKKHRRVREIKLIAALAIKAAEELEAKARELRACAKDLGYEG